MSISTGVQEKMGIMNRGVVYALWDYMSEEDDELQFREGDCMTVVRREDEDEIEWWWARMGDKEGYIPRNLLGVNIQTEQCLWYKIHRNPSADRRRVCARSQTLITTLCSF